MKQKRITLKQKSAVRDYGKDLYDAILFMIGLLGVLWYFKI